MQHKSWLLPDGIVELTGASALQLESIRRRVLDIYNQWGYSLIFPPLVEFLDSLIAGAGDELELQTFKLTDQVSGRMLGVRADITPQVARHDAYHNSGEVNRLCYAGSVLHTRPTHILANRSLIQAGAELYGHKGVSSDLEIIELLLSTLATSESEQNTKNVTSANPWTLTFGDAGITRTLLEHIKIPANGRTLILNALKHRSEPDLIEIASSLELQKSQIDQLIALANLCGNHTILEQVAKIAPMHEQACLDLHNIYTTCTAHYPDIHWFFDFSSINNYAYETGILFHATHASSAEPLARGGRYDNLSKIYGADRPAVGFSCDLLAMARQAQVPPVRSETPTHLWAPSFAAFTTTSSADATTQSSLRNKVNELRSQEFSVTTSVHQSNWQDLDSSIQEKYDGYLTFDGSEWSVQPLRHSDQLISTKSKTE